MTLKIVNQQNKNQRGFIDPKYFAWFGAVLLLAGALWMLPHGRLHNYGMVPWFLGGATVMLVGFFLSLTFPPHTAWLFWSVALSARVVLLFQSPGDDIYRYVWEGHILLAGWNPYLQAPDAAGLEPLRNGLWQLVQHKTFTAIYPPLAQWVMATLAAIWATPVFFKMVFALADLAVAALLVKRFGIKSSVLYAWNPLVIYSFAGGGHYDSIFILTMVLGWMAWSDGKKISSVCWLGAAVAIKWLALPLLAWVGWRIFVEAWKTRRWSIALLAAVAGCLPLTLSYLALCAWTGEWTLQLYPPKFSQYARSAEFLPEIVGWFWDQSKYHNQWFVLPLALAWAWIILRGRAFARSAEAIFFVALILTPMMHAWYLTWIIPFAVATRNRGTVFVTASGFVYFMLYHHVETPNGEWALRIWETGLLWLPFVLGFLWSALPAMKKSTL